MLLHSCLISNLTSTSIHWIFLYLLHIRNLLLVPGTTYHDHIASKLSFQQAKQTELFKPASLSRHWLTPLQLRCPLPRVQEENKSHHAICRVINFTLCQQALPTEIAPDANIDLLETGCVGRKSQALELPKGFHKQAVANIS